MINSFFGYIDNAHNLSNITAIIIPFVTILLVIESILILRSTSLITSVIFTSIFSLTAALIYLALDAPDVAITEACVGACMTTVFCLCAISKLPDQKLKKQKINYLGLFISLSIAIIFFFAFTDLPYFGAADSPSMLMTGNYYIENSGKEIGIYSIVASILASYRGFDTLLETTVIFAAGLSCYLVIGKEFKK